MGQGKADTVAFRVMFIANPDLTARFATHASLNVPRPEFFYTSIPEGYTDYPRIEVLRDETPPEMG